jgi:hypothetical protein
LTRLDTANDQVADVKTLRNELVATPSAREKSLEEARVIRVLTHPNVIALHEADTDSESSLS